MSILSAYIISIIGCVCLTIVLARGTIFDEIKYQIINHTTNKLEIYTSDFLYCPMCIGFWVGLLFELYNGYIMDKMTIVALLYSGAIVSISSYTLDIMITNLINKERKNGV